MKYLYLDYYIKTTYIWSIHIRDIYDKNTNIWDAYVKNVFSGVGNLIFWNYYIQDSINSLYKFIILDLWLLIDLKLRIICFL